MWTALLRKARVDTLGQPLQTALVFVVVAAATATFTFALTTAQSVGLSRVRTAPGEPFCTALIHHSKVLKCIPKKANPRIGLFA